MQKLGRVRTVPRLCGFYPRICLTTEEKSRNKKFFIYNLYIKSKHTFCDRKTFSENLTVYEIMWKNMVESHRTQLTIWYGACSFHAG